MAAFRRVKAAMIGTGGISRSYLGNIIEKFHVLEMVGCSDLIPERSAEKAEAYGIRQMTNEEIWNDPSIEIVINTTYPLSHYAVTKHALLAGKHVYTEKMMAVELEEGRELAALAHEKGLLFTTAPDTFLGGGWQTARNIIDSGWIGEPVAAMCLCIRAYKDHGDREFDPKIFVFGAGGGIPFDMGGYYLHNLINLFGGMTRVSGFARTRDAQRAFTNPRHPRFGGGFTMDSPNTMAASLEFESGLLANLTITSEDSIASKPRFEVHGTQGSLMLFDPNDFGGEILLRRNTQDQYAPIPSLFPYVTDTRGIGVADMAYALLNGRKPRADASMGLHAFEAVHGVMRSGAEGKVVEMQSHVERPRPLPLCDLAGSAYESILNN